MQKKKSIIIIQKKKQNKNNNKEENMRPKIVPNSNFSFKQIYKIIKSKKYKNKKFR